MDITVTKEIENLIYLLTCSLCDKEPDINRVREMDLKGIFELAICHSLAAMVAFSLERVISLPAEFDQAKKKAIRKLALFDVERSRILNCMDNEGIWYMPLKGSILKDYYPKYGMREMADNDILCDAGRMQDVKQIMEQLGFQCDKYEERVDDTYTKKPLVFEIHRYLFDETENKKLFDYYQNIKEKLILVRADGFEYSFSSEDFYIFMLAHEYKHYTLRGTGLRSLVDTFVFLRKWNEVLNWKYIYVELEKLGLSVFEKQNRELAYSLFFGGQLSDSKKDMLMYFVTSGTFGTEGRYMDYVISSKLSGDDSSKSKWRYLKSRILISGEDLQKFYPFFAKNTWLIPFLQIYRLFIAIFLKPRTVFREYQRIKQFKYDRKDNDLLDSNND